MAMSRVIRGGTIAVGVAAVCLSAGELQAQQRGGHRGGQGGGGSAPPPPAPVATRPSAPVSSGRGHFGVGMSRSTSVQSTGELMYYPGPGFGVGIGQGVGFNLGQGLQIPPGGLPRQRFPGHHGGQFAGGWRWGGFYGGAYVVAPYVYSGTYPIYAQPSSSYGDQPMMPDESGAAMAPAAPTYHGPTSILRKPPSSFAPSRAEGYPMGRYPIVMRPARARPPDSSAANPGAIGGFVIEEFEAGTVRVRWPDDGRGVREVTLFTEDGLGQRLATKTLDAAPFTTVFDVTPRTRTIGVTVVRPDGSKATTTVPYRAH